jgi:hypothetical protein
VTSEPFLSIEGSIGSIRFKQRNSAGAQTHTQEGLNLRVSLELWELGEQAAFTDG